jgi:hypothetical protein
VEQEDSRHGYGMVPMNHIVLVRRNIEILVNRDMASLLQIVRLKQLMNCQLPSSRRANIIA